MYRNANGTAGRTIRPLTTDDLRRKAPSVFASTPWGGMSDRYQFVPTTHVIDVLGSKGFVPVRAEQSQTRIEGKGDFTRHMLRFRHVNDLSPMNLRDEVAELVLTNSHDGTSCYRFDAGIFRLVCLNGMVVKSSDFGSVHVKHIGNDHDFDNRIIDATYEVVSVLPRTLEKIADWKQIQLTGPQREAYAEAAMQIKEFSNVTPRQLVAPTRPEDHKSDLWTTSNVVQEHVMRGGIRSRTETGRRQTTRAIKSVNEDVRVNRALWMLTERMAELVG
jgi:hypothetical protein